MFTLSPYWYFVSREVYDEFTILANSWRYSQQYSSELFFVKVDIDEGGMDAFQQVSQCRKHQCSCVFKDIV